MIPDNALSNRLNAVMKGEEIPVQKSTDNIVIKNKKHDEIFDYKLTVFKAIFSIVDVLAASILIGYATRGVFGMGWSPLETVGIGFVLNGAWGSVKALAQKLLKL